MEIIAVNSYSESVIFITKLINIFLNLIQFYLIDEKL